MGERKRVTRAEAQERTREEILDAAEELFLDRGLRATTTAAIAAAAGRTQGAIYANFPNKEDLCSEVLYRRGMQMLSQLSLKLATTGGRLETHSTQFTELWTLLIEDERIATLLVEYAVSIQNDRAHQEVPAPQFDTGFGMLSALMSGSMPAGITPERRDQTLKAALATLAGLAVQRFLGMIDEATATDVIARTLRMWTAELEPFAVIDGST